MEVALPTLVDITGKNQDECMIAVHDCNGDVNRAIKCMIAVHDCNGDVNRAINVLLEGNPDTVSTLRGSAALQATVCF
ncbi:UNVERIFIED_CONTAM: hypothetical protein FKN15_040980 [Acipenser sinensis]